MENIIDQSSIQRMVAFLDQTSRQKGFSSAVLGLSGGIDSAVVARLCQLAFKQSTLALIMPSSSSHPSSLKDALALCETFKIAYEVVELGDFERIFLRLNPKASRLRVGNFCARMRMNLLFDKSHERKSLVIGTSNKSELMLGYGTLYGDLACAINPIAPFYKTQIYQIARLLEIPQNIIDKKPSADLYEGQSDEEELGYGYKEIDPFLQRLEALMKQGVLESHQLASKLLSDGFSQAMTDALLKRVQENAFKLEKPIFLSD